MEDTGRGAGESDARAAVLTTVGQGVSSRKGTLPPNPIPGQCRYTALLPARREMHSNSPELTQKGNRIEFVQCEIHSSCSRTGDEGRRTGGRTGFKVVSKKLGGFNRNSK